jgi:F-box protein 22
MGIAFTGDNVKVASVILGQKVNNRSGIEQKLKKLKDCHIPDVNQVGFMFACIGRGEYFHKEKNFESSVFHAMFPKVPLFGFFGNGEIGYDYLPDYSKPGVSTFTLLGEYPDEETGVIFDMPEINHSYTTIFVLVSLGDNT